MKRKYLDVKEAADYLGMSERFIRRLTSERRIAFHKAGAHLRLAVEDLDAFMTACRIEPITGRSVLRDLRAVA